MESRPVGIGFQSRMRVQIAESTSCALASAMLVLTADLRLGGPRSLELIGKVHNSFSDLAKMTAVRDSAIACGALHVDLKCGIEGSGCDVKVPPQMTAGPKPSLSSGSSRTTRMCAVVETGLVCCRQCLSLGVLENSLRQAGSSAELGKWCWARPRSLSYFTVVL
jgi:hypothetical protein